MCLMQKQANKRVLYKCTCTLHVYADFLNIICIKGNNQVKIGLNGSFYVIIKQFTNDLLKQYKK
jgi:hypothetical protein